MNDEAYFSNKKAKEFNEYINKSLVDFCSPLLDQFNIKWFGYIKLYPDGKRFIITTNKEWLNHYLCHDLQNDLVHTNNLDMQNWDPQEKITYNLWGGLIESKVFKHCYENNMWNGLFIYRKKKNSSEIFSFSTFKEHTSVSNFYINNLTFLMYFIFLFTDKFSFLVNKEEKENLIYPSIKTPSSENPLIMLNKNFNDKISDFYKKTDVKRFYFKDTPNIYATKQESICLQYLLKGFTEKETAQALNLSTRTVESYLNNLKMKLNCQYKSEVLDIYSQGFLI